MKPLILILLSALTSFAATTYPVLTDVPQRTFTGGGTNVSLLSGTNSYTGTNTFPAASFYKANNMAFRLLYSNPTNINVASVAVVALSGDGVTNNGDFALCTPLLQITLPALLGTNSSLYFAHQLESPQANASAAGLALYVGENTNFVGYQNSGLGGASRGSQGGILQSIMVNGGSFTNQFVGSLFGGNQRVFGLNNFCGTDTNFTVYLGAYTATGCTNINLRKIMFFELVND